MEKRSDIILVFILVFVTVFLFMYPDEIKETAFGSLKLCARSVVPVLFPFMLISGLLTTSETFIKLVSHLPFGKIYGLGNIASCPILFGCFFGFPVGAKCAVDMYKRGISGKEEAELIIAVSNNSGPAFIVSVIGASFWKSTKLGILLYAAQLISGVLSGVIITRFIYPHHISRGDFRAASVPASKRFTDSVNGAVTSVITVCGYICTFSVLSEILKLLIKDRRIYITVISFLEITSASQTASSFGTEYSLCMCAFAVGFSGLSVISQVSSFAAENGLSVKKLIIVKLLQGVICALLILPFSPPEQIANVFSAEISPACSYALLPVILMFMAKITFKSHKMKKSLDL